MTNNRWKAALAVLLAEVGTIAIWKFNMELLGYLILLGSGLALFWIDDK